jgi:hypothetical protein
VKITGTVTRDGEPARCYVRLLDRAGEFVGEVRTDGAGAFAFHVVPGAWTVRVISAEGSSDTPVVMSGDEAVPLTLTV